MQGLLCTQYKNYKNILITVTECKEKYKTDWKVEILHEIWTLPLPFVQKIDHHKEITAMIALFRESMTVIDNYFSV